MKVFRLLPLLLLAIGCTDNVGDLDAGTPKSDAGPSDGGVGDVGPRDAGAIRDSGVPDGGDQCTTPADCMSCAADGVCCFFSINCQPGSICNELGDPLFDPTKPEQVCIRIVCDGDDDCDPGEVCSPEKICVTSTCQTNDDCPSAERCIDGACVPDPATAVASCTVLGDAVIVRSTSQRPVHVVAFDSSGRVLVGRDATLAVSDTTVATPGLDRVEGGNVPGVTVLSATVDGVVCDGQITVTNLGVLPPNGRRVTAMDQRTGAPIAGATVTAETSAGVLSFTATNGTAILPLDSPSAITISAANYATVSIVRPGGIDLIVPVPRIGFTETAGIRGIVDVNSVPRADMPIAITGSNLSDDILVFGRTPLTGRDKVLTTINSPQLGINETSDLPSGFVFGLGREVLTADGAGIRCQGAAPAMGQVGCFLTRGRAGYGAGWTLGGQLRLSTIMSLTNELSTFLETGANQNEVINSLAHVIPEMNHGVDPVVLFQPAPNVHRQAQTGDCTDPSLDRYNERCGPDFRRFERNDLRASQPQSVLSTVELPALPRAGATTVGPCATTVSVVAGARIGGRGIVPLGIGAGTDIEADGETPDCVVAGVEAPFGPQSARLPDGQVALYSAPRHSGLEDGELLLMAIARGLGDDPIARSVIVQHPTRLDRRISIGGDFLYLPQPVIDTVQATIVDATWSGSLARAELYAGGAVWVVYYPPNATGIIDLPADAAGRAVLNELNGAIVVAMDTALNYQDVFDLGQSVRAHETAAYVDRFASTGCQRGAVGGCTIR